MLILEARPSTSHLMFSYQLLIIPSQIFVVNATVLTLESQITNSETDYKLARLASSMPELHEWHMEEYGWSLDRSRQRATSGQRAHRKALAFPLLECYVSTKLLIKLLEEFLFFMMTAIVFSLLTTVFWDDAYLLRLPFAVIRTSNFLQVPIPNVIAGYNCTQVLKFQVYRPESIHSVA